MHPHRPKRMLQFVLTTQKSLLPMAHRKMSRKVSGSSFPQVRLSLQIARQGRRNECLIEFGFSAVPRLQG